ncbi:glycosyl transferase family 1 [Bergeyella sp. RCAD1439]|uniref:glycosyl transferase family 1 n=1 Tax=Bergeyella anatis TaxID=3113737 RepID=UPI002E187652|nr:glycosyl transferase family 1 [Bergeyella sp. RCAD1439]
MAEKKVLIVSYYWPPAGGPGVQRWLKFAKYLPEFGWSPTVFIPQNPSYPLMDESLVDEVPEGISTIRTPIWEPYQWAEKLNKNNKKYKAGQFDVGHHQNWKSKLSIWVRGNFFIPDARVFWVRPSVNFLKKHLREHSYEALVTTGPPHSLHLIGLKLKRHFPDLKWIADFRDPWTEISYYKHLKLTSWADRKHRVLEEKVFKTADLTLATSFTDAENFRKKGANAVCLTNGFDKEAQLVAPSPKSKRFAISYIGVLEQLRTPKILWQALEELVGESPDFKSDLEIRFVGRVDEKIAHTLKSTLLSSAVYSTGYLSHQEALEEMANAALLLLTNFPEAHSRGIIPGKLFEYLASGKPILSFGPNGADVARILEETHSGSHFTYDEKEKVKTFILETYRQWKNHDTVCNFSRTDIESYSRRALTKKLSEILQR